MAKVIKVEEIEIDGYRYDVITYDNGAIVKAIKSDNVEVVSEQIELEPTQLDNIEAQVTYIAMMI